MASRLAATAARSSSVAAYVGPAAVLAFVVGSANLASGGAASAALPLFFDELDREMVFASDESLTV
jgi:hypothetical protein